MYVYGPQKGIRQNDLEDMERKMSHFAEKTTEHVKKDFRTEKEPEQQGDLVCIFQLHSPCGDKDRN